MDSFLAKVLAVADKLDAHQVISELEFKGFDPMAYLDTISKDSIELSLKIGITGAIRGGNWNKLKDTHIDFAAAGYVEELSPGKKDATVKTILRTTAVLAPEIAHILEKDGSLKKRIKDSVVPACLQFPAAGSITMGPKARAAHIDYCKRFSALLPGGQFNQDIYNAMCKSTRDMAAISDEVRSFISQ
jgi:hypothetical protein